VIPHAEVSVLDACGHFIHHDKIEEAAKVITEFVRKL